MSKSRVLLSALVLVLNAGLAKAELVMEAGYVRASLPGSTTTSAYMTLVNTGDSDLVITSVTTTAAAKVSFHDTMNHEGMLHMMDMENLKIAAHKSAVLESGGMHLMLENTTALLAPNSKVELVLQFAGGQKKTILLPVRSVLAEKN